MRRHFFKVKPSQMAVPTSFLTWNLEEEELRYNLRKHIHPQIKNISIQCFPCEGQLQVVESRRLAFIIAHFDSFKTKQLHATSCLITGQICGQKVQEVLIVRFKDKEAKKTLVPRRTDSTFSTSFRRPLMNMGNTVVIETTNTGEAKTTKVSVSLGNHSSDRGILVEYELPGGGKVLVKPSSC